MLFVTSEGLAQILDISERRVNQIAKEGIIFSRDQSGKFNAPICVEAYYKARFSPDEIAVSLDQERALHERAKREMAEIELARIKNKMFTDDEVKLAIAPMLIAMRNRILALAPTISEKLVGKNAKEIEMILDKANRDALTELSQYDQIKFGSGEYEIIEDN